MHLTALKSQLLNLGLGYFLQQLYYCITFAGIYQVFCLALLVNKIGSAFFFGFLGFFLP